MELQVWVQFLLMIQISQDLLEGRVYSLTSTASCNNPHHYAHGETHVRCCSKCPAGKMVKKHCLDGKPNTTICQNCREGTYRSQANGKTFCIPCSKEYKPNRILLSNCTSSHNQKYGPCKDGYYYNAVLDSCSSCRSCPAGYGVEQACTNITNTICSESKCTLGTYSDQDSPTQKCRPCTHCQINQEMFRECTATTDYGCRNKPISTTQATEPTVSTRENKSTEVNLPVGSPKSSNSSRNWVVPYFISAMTLLLLLFLGFVIGVAIWCNRHSKKKRNRPCVESPVDECPKMKCLHEAQTTLLSTEEPERYQLVQTSQQMCENGMLLRDVPHDIIQQLARLLNPNNTNNWKMVATKLGFSWDLIRNLELTPSTATEKLLEGWGTKKDATVYRLYMVFKEIERDDAADVLKRLLREPCPSYLRSV